MQACREDQVDLLKLKKKRNCDLSDFVAWSVPTGLSISESADLLQFSHTTISWNDREWSEKREKISNHTLLMTSSSLRGQHMTEEHTDKRLVFVLCLCNGCWFMEKGTEIFLQH